MKVTLPDGTPLELADGATGADAARAVGELSLIHISEPTRPY